VRRPRPRRDAAPRSGRLHAGATAVALAGAVFGLLALASAAPARAFVYASGDLVAVFVDGGTELVVNLGPLATLAPNAVFDVPTPAGFGSDGAIGARFLAYSTRAPFSGTAGRNVTYTVPPVFYPPAYDADVTGFVSRLGLAQNALDDGGAPDKFLEFLTLFPAPPQGGIIENAAARLVLPVSNISSYTATIGVAGTSDRIDNNLPFENDVAIDGTRLAALWTSERLTPIQASSVRLGYVEIVGNLGGGTPTARITYLPEPVAGATLAVGAALLAWLAGGRREEIGRDPSEGDRSARLH